EDDRGWTPRLTDRPRSGGRKKNRNPREYDRMKTIRFVAGTAGIAMLASLAAAAPAVAQDARLEELKEQGFARIAIANEPPFTAVGADGKVSGAGLDVARAVFQK